MSRTPSRNTRRRTPPSAAPSASRIRHLSPVLAYPGSDDAVDPDADPKAIFDVEPLVPLPEIGGMEGRVSNTLSARRFYMTLLLVFVGVAVLLASVGLLEISLRQFGCGSPSRHRAPAKHGHARPAVSLPPLPSPRGGATGPP